MTSNSTFKSVFSARSMFLFHLLFLVFLAFANCSCITLFFHSSFFSLTQLCLDTLLFTVSLNFIVSSAFTPAINDSIEFLRKHPKLFSSILIHASQIINPLPPVSLLSYTLSTLLLGCSASYIVINFLVLLSLCILFQNSCHISHCKNCISINCHNFITSIQFRS